MGKTVSKAWQFIQESAVFKLYFINTSWIMAEKILRILLSFFVVAAMARYLGPIEFGIYSFCFSLVTLGQPISNLGLDSLLVKEFVHKNFSHEELLGTSLLMRFFSTILVNTLIFLISYFFVLESGLETKVLAIMMIANIFQAFNVVDFFFQSQVQAKLSSICLSLSFFSASILRLFLIWREFSLIYFSYSLILEYSLFTFFLLISLKNHTLSIRSLKVKSHVLKTIIKESIPLILSGVFIVIYMKIDQVMLKSMLGNKQTGLYSSAVKLSEFWYLLPTTLSVSLYPLLARNFKENFSLYMHRLKFIMGVCFWFFLILSLGVYFSGDFIVETIFGVEYLGSIETLKIHMFAGIVTSMSIFYAQKYVLEKRTKLSLFGAITGAISNVILNIILIPRLGIEGAAWATLISYILPTLSISLIFDRSIGVTFLKSISYVFVAKRFTVDKN